jgi:hypothetical protein
LCRLNVKPSEQGQMEVGSWCLSQPPVPPDSLIILSTGVKVQAVSVLGMQSAVGTVPRLEGWGGFAVQFAVVTYSMEQSPSWEANRFAASQEILHIL